MQCTATLLLWFRRSVAKVDYVSVTPEEWSKVVRADSAVCLADG